MERNGKVATKIVNGNGNGATTLTTEDVHRYFGDEYREVEVLSDGTVRARPEGGDMVDQMVTRTLKTGRTWY